ncbi:helix-turn-helix domain-containing protein [Buttiauxella agrestis]
MPWTETRPMQRLDFIRACHAGTEPFSTLCRHFGISRKTGYKWLQRFNPDDPASLFDQPRARLTHAERLPPEIIQQLIDVRVTHPDWGPKKSAPG